MLQERLNNDLKEAMKSGESVKVGVLRMLRAALKNKLIENKSQGNPEELTGEDVTGVLRKEAKKRKEAADAFEKGGRLEMAGNEKRELEILEAYLPKQMNREEVEKEVKRILSSLKDKSNIGLVMKAMMRELKGKADGKMISEAVREKLR